MNRIYEINDKYFNKIDSQDKAYFLGLLFADGCNGIYKSRNTKYRRLSIGLKLEDRYLLDLFKYYIKSNQKLILHNVYNKKYDKEYKVICLNIHNKNICEDLEKLGMTPRKSLTLEFPTSINDKELMWHFIRGYFDGDGCITINRYLENRYRGAITICGSLPFCEELKRIIISEIKVKCSIIKTGKIYTLNIHSNHGITSFMNKLYHNSGSELFMKRKYNKFCEFIEKTNRS